MANHDSSSTFQLCMDQGNSSTKIAVFEGDKLLEFKTYKNLEIQHLNEIIDRFPIKSCIISSVVDINDELYQFLNQNIENFIVLNHTTLVPFENRYKTPETLGKDRIAAIVGAKFLQPNTDLLVIDVGTAITYDFIDAYGVYHGGNIAPGIDMRLRSLHEFTQKLPLVEAQADTPLFGFDTKSAILSGVINGIIFEIDGYIDSLKFKYPELSIYLTGGSTFYFYTKLKNPIFAEKYLVLIGLNRILQFNV